jgi:hypothetical protein
MKRGYLLLLVTVMILELALVLAVSSFIVLVANFSGLIDKLVIVHFNTLYLSIILGVALVIGVVLDGNITDHVSKLLFRDGGVREK